MNEQAIAEKFHDGILDIEDLHQMAKTHEFCPFYYMQKLQVTVQCFSALIIGFSLKQT